MQCQFTAIDAALHPKGTLYRCEACNRETRSHQPPERIHRACLGDPSTAARVARERTEAAIRQRYWMYPDAIETALARLATCEPCGQFTGFGGKGCKVYCGCQGRTTWYTALATGLCERFANDGRSSGLERLLRESREAAATGKRSG
jgi:hypothetical protein